MTSLETLNASKGEIEREVGRYVPKTFFNSAFRVTDVNICITIASPIPIFNRQYEDVSRY